MQPRWRMFNCDFHLALHTFVEPLVTCSTVLSRPQRSTIRAQFAQIQATTMHATHGNAGLFLLVRLLVHRVSPHCAAHVADSVWCHAGSKCIQTRNLRTGVGSLAPRVAGHPRQLSFCIHDAPWSSTRSGRFCLRVESTVPSVEDSHFVSLSRTPRPA